MDLEFALLAERGLVGEDTTIVTTVVHELQLVDEDLLDTEEPPTLLGHRRRLT